MVQVSDLALWKYYYRGCLNSLCDSLCFSVTNSYRIITQRFAKETQRSTEKKAVCSIRIKPYLFTINWP